MTVTTDGIEHPDDPPPPAGLPAVGFVDAIERRSLNQHTLFAGVVDLSNVFDVAHDIGWF